MRQITLDQAGKLILIHPVILAATSAQSRIGVTASQLFKE